MAEFKSIALKNAQYPPQWRMVGAQRKPNAGACKYSLGFSDTPRSNGNGVHRKERNMRSKIFAPRTQKVSYDARFTSRYEILAICSQLVELSLLNSIKKLDKSTFPEVSSQKLHCMKKMTPPRRQDADTNLIAKNGRRLMTPQYRYKPSNSPFTANLPKKTRREAVISCEVDTGQRRIAKISKLTLRNESAGQMPC